MKIIFNNEVDILITNGIELIDSFVHNKNKNGDVIESSKDIRFISSFEEHNKNNSLLIVKNLDRFKSITAFAKM